MRAQKTHSAHWGVFSANMEGARLHIRPFDQDPDPNPLTDNFLNALDHPARIRTPAVRRGWLENGPGPDNQRGADEYIAISWDKAFHLLTAELQRVNTRFGPEAIFGGSYGWSSAGRFHHAQSQVHRFLNIALGGYVRSVNTYSSGAASVLLPHIIGDLNEVARRGVNWEQIAQYTDVVIAFGGMALKNSRVASGGISEHTEKGFMRQAAARGARFINISPLQSDMPAESRAEWIGIRPGTDSALILAILHTLVSRRYCDEHFLATYCVGWERFLDYLLGETDGQPKTPEWASAICGIDACQIDALAASLHNKRVLVTVAHALQRAEHGEQPVWLGMVLAAALGQHGLPGGGYAYALGALGHYGKHHNQVAFPALPQGVNGINRFIPVARIADCLLHPGEPFAFNGQTLTYPDIKLAYWAGGNPFHHHQDLGRLRRAFSRLDTLIVHEIAWTATARHADIVLPATMTLEREDIGGTPTDPHLVAMHRIAEPFAEAKDDYAIFTELSRRLGKEEAFTEGRTSREWLQHLYQQMRTKMQAQGEAFPDFDAFWEQGIIRLPQCKDGGRLLSAFRHDPIRHPLPTPSGKLEIFSETIAGFGYRDCPGHPVWLEPEQRPTAAFPLYLIANQPATRLHSQLDFGLHSVEGKRREREVCRLHPEDARRRGIGDGDIVRLFNTRGACLACAQLSSEIVPGVIQLPTGAWFDPDDPLAELPFCRHGNPNVLTLDKGTSALGQGCCGQITVVEVERFTGPIPPVTAFVPPPFRQDGAT
ncbi:molybdopterin guanine dinucleotide-containing S/N-oxide reductase [Brenneria rubrifaciens]|uniref:Asp-tRNA(Asn)/Glu-tRNA(Gln) amidotransferase GatCAB subunit C n=1 Tax=Brenneria rubrifaciens TaxID=55213 RepID=A0A4P8QKM9_9GAMM|nr:molybdopterin guanine dinucleotide-containing S/N-oxide reductase [Brenneria rubrifaciens]QCR07622.1 Asp-tRNA(Asn)/Glu-tRNA(Gln) amidotransferase GatCAB subunit C [Brenneria rubrifaciens]